MMDASYPHTCILTKKWVMLLIAHGHRNIHTLVKRNDFVEFTEDPLVATQGSECLYSIALGCNQLDSSVDS